MEHPTFAGNLMPALVAAGLGTVNGPDINNVAGKGLNVYINITAISGTTPTLTVTVQGKDPVSGQYFTILASTALAATGFTRMIIYPGVPAVANASDNDVLPDTFRVIAAVGGTGPSVTATISGCIIP